MAGTIKKIISTQEAQEDQWST